MGRHPRPGRFGVDAGSNRSGAQSAAAKGPPKGPRALGLVQLSANGKAHLIPITILFDGEFYDASAYKAAPVPMALESGTVYEGIAHRRFAGIVHGLQRLAGEQHMDWRRNLADGQRAGGVGRLRRPKGKKRVSKPAPEPVEGPPVLRRASCEQTPELDRRRRPLRPSTPPTGICSCSFCSLRLRHPPPPPATPPAAAPTPTVADEDPDRPVLKRGAPSPAEMKKRNAQTPVSGICGQLGLDVGAGQGWRASAVDSRAVGIGLDCNSFLLFRTLTVPTRVPMPTPQA